MFAEEGMIQKSSRYSANIALTGAITLMEIEF